MILGSHNSLETIASFSSGSERRWWMLEVKWGITGVLPLRVVTISFRPTHHELCNFHMHYFGFYSEYAKRK
jgi:hypothetical protein